MSINQVKQLVEMETNIWACIYRSLNRKKNIRYENDDVNGTNSDYFLSDYEKSVERLSVSRVFGKRYREEEDHKMEKLIEQDNESSSDESNDMSFSSLLNSKNQDVHRGTERNYKSHFRISLKNNQEEEKEQDDTSSKCDTSRKKPKRRTKVRRITDVEQQKQTKFFDEELLVIYYATTLIMINKQQDALKAVSEYLQKRGISELASANLYKIYAVLLMMNKNCSHEDIVTAVKYFKKAGQLFYSVGCKKGLGLCKLGLAKIHHQYVPELLLEMKDKNEDMMLEASLNFAQNALKLFKQISYATGEYHSDLLEAGLKKKTNNQERGFKATQHYIELSKRAQKEKTELRQISWVTSEYVLLLEIVLDDVSHLAPEEQHQIKKINGTLVSVLAKNSKKHTRNSSKLENFQNLTTNLKPSTLAIEDKVDSPRDTNTKLNQKRKSVHKPKPSSKNAAEVSKSTITVKLQSYQPQTPFKESRSKGAKMPEQAQPKISVKNTLSKDESKKDLKMWKI